MTKVTLSSLLKEWIPPGPLLPARPAVPEHAQVVTSIFYRWGPRHPKDGYFTSYEEQKKTCFVWVPVDWCAIKLTNKGREAIRNESNSMGLRQDRT